MRASDELLNQAASLRENKAPNLAEQARPSDLLLDEITTEQRTRADLVLDTVTKLNPDKAAQANQLGRDFGLDQITVQQNQDELARLARAKQLQAAMQESPFLVRQMTDPQFAAIAQDDAQNLTALDSTLAFFRNTGSAAVSGLQGASAGVVGMVQAPFDVAAPLLDPLVGRILPGNPLRATAEGLSRYRQGIERTAQANMPQADGVVGSGFYSGIGSLARNLAALPMAFLPGGQSAALTAMVAPVAGQEFGKARDQGMAPLGALSFGASQAAIEYATEKLPLAKLLGDVKAGTPLFQTLARQMALEVPGEQMATVLQDLNEWAALNPQKSFSEYLAERPSAAAQTLVATLVGTGGQVTVVKGVQTAIERFAGNQGKAQAAAQDAKALDALVKTAAQSKVRTRDADTFEQFVARATEDGPVQDLFIDARTFAQTLGEDNLQQVLAQVPAVQEQFQDALDTGGVLAIPLEQFAARMPTELAQSLVPYLRTAPEAMTPAEAQEFAQDGVNQTQAEIDQLVEQAPQVEPAAPSGVDQVRTQVLDLLNNAGRFTPDVNRNYGELVTQFLNATATREGMDVQQLFADFGPRVVTRLDAARGPVLDAQPGQVNQDGIATDAPLGDVVNAQGEAASSATQGDLEQGQRGSYNPATRTITLLENADLSTFIHEAGHYFLEIQAELASREGASEQIKADMQALLNWFGVKDLATWQAMDLEQKRESHERFARGFEAYAFEGNAPSLELQGVFQRFRAWLTRVYRSIVALNVELTPEVRSVMDRMVATEVQIAAAQAQRAYTPLFESAEAAGMTAEEFAAYQATGQQATTDAVEDLQRRSLRDMQWLANAKSRALRKLQRQAEDTRKAVRAEVEAELRDAPEYAAQRWLKTGELPDGTKTVGAKLSAKALAEMYGDGPATPRRYLSTDMVDAQEGMHPDMVAEMFGFESGDELVRAIVNAGKEAEAIEAMTDQRMLERYGDLTDSDTISRAADALIHNEARARFLEREVNTLAKAVGNRPVIARAARQYAEEAIARKQVAKIRPAQFSQAETRAGREAEQAFKKGDVATAAARKREQLLQNQLARVAHNAVDEIQRAVDYLGKFDSETTRKAIGPEYAEQIDALLERYDLRSSTTLRAIAKRKSLAQWIESQQALGLDPLIDERLLADSALKSYKEMTLEELRGLRDTVRNIEHLGRLKQRLLTAQDARSFAERVEEAARSITEFGGKAKTVELEGRKGVLPWLQGMWASQRKISSLMRQMDGSQDNGVMWNLFVRPMNEASNREQVMIEEATVKLAEIYGPVMNLKGGLTGDKRFIAEIGASLSRGGRLAVALNWGNPTNRQRLLDGDGWNPAQVDAILGTLTTTELEFVNQVWEFIDSYWPEVQAKQLRVDGVAEQKVQGEPFVLTSSDGTQVQMFGGYYPLKYDSDRSSRAESLEAAEVAKDMMRGAFTRATTRRGHTKARAEIVKRPVRKDLGVITQHVNEVVHDLAWHEWLIDANRLMGAKPIDQAIRTFYGPDIVRTLKDDLVGIATADVVAQTKIDEALRVLRNNVSRSVMGLSFTTAMLQPFGLTNSMARIGVKPVLRGIARWAGDASRLESSMEWISEKSDFMRLRSKTFNRELTEISGRVAGKSQGAQVLDGVLFYMTTKMQMIADVPTWIGRYEQAIDQGQDEATAVALADQAVLDAQGGGQTKDLAEVQRKHPFLTQFYSYFSTTLNLTVEKTATTDFKNPKAVAGWLGDMALLLVIPALAPMVALSVLRGDDLDDDELAKKVAQAQAGYLLGMVVLAREFSGLVSGFGYSGPPVSRVVTDTGRAATQLSQGELDEPAVLSIIRLLGTAFGIPTTQAVRSYKGWVAWEEGQAPASAILMGPPQE